MQRVVQAEVLDSLPEAHPDAVACRRDLRRLNFLMGTHRWLRGCVRRLVRSGSARSVLELGAGDGSLALGLSARERSTVRWTGIDRVGTPPDWPKDWGWICVDIRDESQAWPRADVGVVNLLLHHFEADDLRTVLRKLCECCAKIFLCEPVRRRLHVAQLALLRGWFLHPVTWHDARVSVLAGFVPGELRKFFPMGWELRERCCWRGFLRAEANPFGDRR